MLFGKKEETLCKKTFHNMSHDSCIITVNRRLTNYLHALFDHYQKSCGIQVWETPDILPYETWIERCWNQTADDRIVLNSFQEQLLWEKIIQQSELSDGLLQIDRTAKEIKYAWQLLQQWNLTLETIAKESNTDSQAFTAWANEFIRICTQQNYLDHSRLATLLTQQLVQGKKIQLPQRIFLVGFDQTTPQLQTLLDQLKQLQVTIEFLTIETELKTVTITPYENQEQEFYAMAQWAQQCLTQNNNSAIACIIPNLSNVREQIIRIFSEMNLTFNISIGKLLTNYPLVAYALQTFKLIAYEPSTAQISRWLRSPFLGGAESEMSARAMLDKILHEQGELHTSFRTILALAQQSQSTHYCPILTKQLQEILNLLKNISAPNFPSQWSILFNCLLHSIGCPGQRTLNSAEYQTWQRWQELLLIEFSGLDFLLGKITVQQAINILFQLTTSVIFQPQTTETNIQILGILESSGLQFDYLWMSGMNDESWPPVNHPNPFIPIKIQRQLKMPHASAHIEFEFYQRLTQRIMQSAATIIFSYPTHSEDRALRISPILKNHQETPNHLEIPKFNKINYSIFSTRRLENLTDHQAPAIQNSEIVKGGSNIIKYQATCPFSAFAKYRLNATSLKIPGIGLNAAEKGQMLHSALEIIWNTIENKHQLDNYSEYELEKMTSAAIEKTLLEYIPKKPLIFKKRFIEIEQQRLKKILMNWLIYEKNRQSFKILNKEQSRQIKIGNLELKIRIDRIDQLEDGSCLIIDYKTGETSIQHWFSERPAEPQLPLYCVTSEKMMSGLVFAQIQPHEMKFKGFAINSEVMPNLTPIEKLDENIPKSWEKIIAYWQENLFRLANDFCAGDAKVDPKNLKESCRYCDLQPLCRINELKELNTEKSDDTTH